MKQENKVRLIKLLIILLCFIVLGAIIYLPLKYSGLLEKINNVESLKEIILSFGIYSYLIFFVIQFLQVTFLPIPAFITTVAGALVFGPWLASILSCVSIMLASIFSFFLGRKFGYKLVVWILGESTTEKWSKKLDKGKYVFFLMMLFPIFPDDILCLVAGSTTNMSYKFFIITNLITRPIGIFATCFLGSGQLIPFSGWGIIVWCILIVLGAIIFVLSYKYQPQIEEFIYNLSNKISRKK